MRIVRWLSIAILIFLLLTAVAVSETESVIVQGVEHFLMQNAEALGDDRILICGSTGSINDSKGAMYIIDTEENSRNITPPADNLEGMYRDAFMLDERTMIALRSVPGEFEWRVALLDDGEIIWNTKSVENVFFLERMGDCFLMYCKPEPDTAEIRCLDFDGNEKWKIRLEERILLEGILVGEDMHIAYGSKMEDPVGDKDQRSTSLIFAFDNYGNILCRQDGNRLGYSTQYDDAVWTDDGGVIVIDNSRVSKYNKEGLLWERDYTTNGMTGIESIENGYLISYHDHSQNGMRFIRINEEGELTGEFYLKEVPEGKNKLILIGDTPYMVFYNLEGKEPMKLMKVDIENYIY